MSFVNFLSSAFRQLTMSNTPVPEPIWDSPSVDDVLAVKEILFQASNIPIELIDSIIDYAEYWPHTSVDTNTSNSEPRALEASGGFNRPKENVFIIRSVPLGLLPEQLDNDTHLGITDSWSANAPKPIKHSEPSESVKSATEELIARWSTNTSVRGNKPCRKIVFTIWSHDQGWGGSREHKGTFQGSYTWFDVGLERIEACDSNESIDLPRFPVTTNTTETEGSSPDTLCITRTIIPPVQEEEGKFAHPFLPTDTHLIRNRTAHRELQKHVITWSYTDNISPSDPAALELDNQGRGKASGNGEFVRNLKVGDVITLWSRARFPGWTNTLEYCQIDVYWAV